MSRTYSTHSISGRDFYQFRPPVGAYGLKNRVCVGVLVAWPVSKLRRGESRARKSAGGHVVSRWLVRTIAPCATRAVINRQTAGTLAKRGAVQS